MHTVFFVYQPAQENAYQKRIFFKIIFSASKNARRFSFCFGGNGLLNSDEFCLPIELQFYSNFMIVPSMLQSVG